MTPIARRIADELRVRLPQVEAAIALLADRFVKDPRHVVRAGDIVKVRVVEVDLKRRRITLTMKRHEKPAGDRGSRPDPAKGSAAAGRPVPRTPAPAQATSPGAAFAKLSRPSRSR